TKVKLLQEWIAIAAEHEAWRVLGYISLDAFLIAEANFTPAIIDAIRQAKGGTVGDAIAKAKANPLRDVGPPTKDERDNVGSSNITGNTNDYLLRRLARDAPEMLDKIE